MKCLLGKVTKYGVYGSWDEVESFKDVTFANKFMLYWPTLKAMVNKLPHQRRMTFSKTLTKGTAAEVLRNLVEDFQLSKFNYPINTNPHQPVLLISEHLDDTKDEVILKKRMKDRENEIRDTKCRNAIKLKVKSGGTSPDSVTNMGLGKRMLWLQVCWGINH